MQMMRGMTFLEGKKLFGRESHLAAVARTLKKKRGKV
jgi:hypothetical protein